MKVRILATGSSGNSVLINEHILVDAGITSKAFKKMNIPLESIHAVIITHKHQDHMKLPFMRYLLTNGVTAYLPTDVIADIVKEGRIEIDPLITTGQITPIKSGQSFIVDDVTITPQPQKHHDIVNYAFVLENENHRLLYSTDLDTLEPTDMGTGLMCLGQFDTILLEGNYDEVYLRAYIEYTISLIPTETNPETLTDIDLEKWVRANYRQLPQDIARNAFRAIQNLRHLSKQQARAYVASHLKPNGRYYEIHRSSQFYEEPVGWREEQ